MVYLAYLGREYGLAKLGVVIVGVVIVGVGCHSYFSSPWVKNEVYQICDLLKNDTSIKVDATCPSLLLEKVFIVVALFTFSLSLLGLVGNLFSRQLSQTFFKLADIVYNGITGLLVIGTGSMFLYSAISIDKLFTEIGEKVIPCVADIVTNSTYQLYEEKVAAGSLSIIQGVIYFGVAGLLLLRA